MISPGSDLLRVGADEPVANRRDLDLKRGNVADRIPCASIRAGAFHESPTEQRRVCDYAHGVLPRVWHTGQFFDQAAVCSRVRLPCPATRTAGRELQLDAV